MTSSSPIHQHNTTTHINKILRRWSLLLNKWTGCTFEPQILLISIILAVLIIQLFVFIAFISSETIYCKLPTLRNYRYTCQEFKDKLEYEELPTIYVVTPTYERYVQKAELLRLSHTFMLVPKLHWIIVEDSNWSTNLVSKIIYRLKDEFNFHTITQLHAKTPDSLKLKKGDPSWKYPKGIRQRNRAITWLRENYHQNNLDSDGVVYFADDDNTYDLELFKEMRFTRLVSVWPVGLVGGLIVERPIVEHDVDQNKHKVKKFNSKWQQKRPFPIDMAGFAVSLHNLIESEEAQFSDSVPIGYVESHFLNQLVNSWDQLEPKANNCRKVLVWHTRTEAPKLHQERKLSTPSDAGIEW